MNEFCLLISSSSLSAILSKASLGGKNLGLGPRSSRLDVFCIGVVDLVLFKFRSVCRSKSRHIQGLAVSLFEAAGKDADVRRVHGESSFLGGVDDRLDVLNGTNHSRKSTVEIIEIGLVGAAASAAVVGSSSVAHAVCCGLYGIEIVYEWERMVFVLLGGVFGFVCVLFYV